MIGLKELTALASNAASLPVDRVVIGFFAPTMVYKAVRTPGTSMKSGGKIDTRDSAREIQREG
jgi:hypothetical protein